MGYWGKDSPARGGELKRLAAIMEQAIPFRATAHAKPRRWIWKQLKPFLQGQIQAANARGMLAAVKYPQLCQAGRQLLSICGESLRVIICDRPIEESIASVIRRTKAVEADREALAAHQRWLAQGRDAFAAEIPDQVLRVEYSELLADPAGQLRRIMAWLVREPTDEQITAGAASVDPAKRHVQTEAAA